MQTLIVRSASPLRGIHMMRLDEIKPVINRWGTESHRFDFKVICGPDTGKEISRYASRSAKQDGSLVKLLSQLAGRELAVGVRVVLAGFIGQVFVVHVASATSSSGDGEYLFIKNVRPAAIPNTQAEGVNE